MASTSLTPAQRSIRARAAAYALHAQGGTSTGAAFAARMAKLEDRIDPERVLTPEERARRVRLALKAQMATLALKASIARSRKRTAPAVDEPGAVVEAGDADAEPASA